MCAPIGRVETRILVRFYEQFSRERYNTDWYGDPEENSEEFQEWMWGELSGTLMEEQVFGVYGLIHTLMDMHMVTEEVMSKLLETGTTTDMRMQLLGRRTGP